MKRREFIINSAIALGGTALLTGCGSENIKRNNVVIKSKTKNRSVQLTEILKKLKDIYRGYDITEERKVYLKNLIEKYGYLPYPHIRALEELNAADTLYGLEIKWKLNKVFSDGKFDFNDDEISPVKRAGYKNADWIKKEQHNIKLVNLTALGNGNYSPAPGNFVDWLKQILILPAGNPEKSILSTTIYLVPFHPRDFGCAYIPTSSGISDAVKDDYLTGNLNITATEQVQLFITLAHLAGHPVIYDVMYHTGRFAKEVLVNPYIARWLDVNKLISEIEDEIDIAVKKLEKDYDTDDIEIVKRIAKSTLRSGSDDMGTHYQKIYNDLCEILEPRKKVISEKMYVKKEQEKLAERVKEVVAKVHGTTPDKIKTEDDITKQIETINELIKEGLWTLPGNAWCGVGLPIFDKMSVSGDYPLFRHYDNKGNDVTKFANLDCQTQYYFVYLESGVYNDKVCDFYIKKLKDLVNLYSFDGIRYDHVDHIVDRYNLRGNKQIGAMIPKSILKKCNLTLKKQNGHFATIAEYMHFDYKLKEYHKDMNFDVIWGFDIILQYTKVPSTILFENMSLKRYNKSFFTTGTLSIIKAYNNQDGEFREIRQFPGQLGEDGAMFKWFKMKFIPGGKYAQRPVMFVDGDESFTTVGTEECINNEVSLRREKNYNFFDKFNAINYYALHNELLTDGTANFIEQWENIGVWSITKEKSKEALLIVANYKPKTELYHWLLFDQEDKKKERERNEAIVEGKPVYDRYIDVIPQFEISKEIVYDAKEKTFVEKEYTGKKNKIYIEKLDSSEFKIYKLIKK